VLTLLSLGFKRGGPTARIGAGTFVTGTSAFSELAEGRLDGSSETKPNFSSDPSSSSLERLPPLGTSQPIDYEVRIIKISHCVRLLDANSAITNRSKYSNGI